MGPLDGLGGIREPIDTTRLAATDKTLKVSPAMAASVTDRLWEIGDLVEMLEAWETKEKRDAKPIFEVLEWKIGGGFYVKAMLPNIAPENITGFITKDDARRWVRYESAAWLHDRRQALEKKKA